MGQQGERLGWSEGNTAGQIDGGVSLQHSVRTLGMTDVSLPLAEAVEDSTGCGDEQVTFLKALARCTTLNAVGCAVYWLLCNPERLSKTQQNSRLLAGIFNSGVWRRVGQQRSALPICEGILSDWLSRCRELTLDEATTIDFSTSLLEISCLFCLQLLSWGGATPYAWTMVEA